MLAAQRTNRNGRYGWSSRTTWCGRRSRNPTARGLAGSRKQISFNLCSALGAASFAVGAGSRRVKQSVPGFRNLTQSLLVSLLSQRGEASRGKVTRLCATSAIHACAGKSFLRLGGKKGSLCGALFAQNCILFAAVFFFGALGKGLALDFGRLTQAFGAATSALFGSS